MRNATKKDFKDIYSNPMSQGTRCHQLATYIVFDSPLTMLADNPTSYRKEQECTDFIASLFLKTDETKIQINIKNNHATAHIQEVNYEFLRKVTADTWQSNQRCIE